MMLTLQQAGRMLKVLCVMMQLAALMTQQCSSGWSHCLFSLWCGQLAPQATLMAGKLERWEHTSE